MAADDFDGPGGAAMPLHDWTRVDAGIYHDFHLGWIAEVRRVLNGGLLPEGYYALAEQVPDEGNPDVLTLRLPHREDSEPEADAEAGGVLTAPPRTRHVARAAVDPYLKLQRRIAVRHTSGHRVIALVELVSSGNKSGEKRYRAFVDKLVDAIDHGVHLLVLDPYPPTRRDPDGVHGTVWGEVVGERYTAPVGEDRTLVAYSAGPDTTAYVEPVAVGQVLRDMPLFLTRDGEGYVEVPLEATYQASYASLPRFYRNILDAPPPLT